MNVMTEVSGVEGDDELLLLAIGEFDQWRAQRVNRRGNAFRRVFGSMR